MIEMNDKLNEAMERLEESYARYCEYSEMEGREIIVPTNASEHFEEMFENRAPETCYCCGEELGDDYETVEITGLGSRHVCSEDCMYEHDYVLCVQCGQWEREDFAYYVGEEFYCSADCVYDAGYSRCGHCDEFMHEDDSYYLDDLDEWWCESCTYDYSYYCEECGRRVSDENWEGEFDCCERCAQENHQALHSYSFSDYVNFVPRGDNKNNSVPFMGIELETERGSNLREYVKELDDLFGNDVDEYYMSQDSSLCGNSAEIVSHPFTLNYHLRNGKWAEIMKIAKKYDYTSSCPARGGCGTHVSISRDFFGKNKTVQDVGGYKMLRMMQRFESMWKVLSERENFGYARFNTRCNYDPKKWATQFIDSDPERMFDYIAMAKYAVRYEYAHELVVNMGHSERFEIRLFSGTLEYDNFMAMLGLCEGLAITAKKRTIGWVERINWYDMIAEIISNISEEEVQNLALNFVSEKECF